MFIYFQNYAASIVSTCESVTKNLCTFITVITQTRTFSLNLGNSDNNFETNKYSLERSFQKNIKKKFFSKFFRKILRSNLKIYSSFFSKRLVFNHEIISFFSMSFLSVLELTASSKKCPMTKVTEANFEIIKLLIQ